MLTTFQWIILGVLLLITIVVTARYWFEMEDGIGTFMVCYLGIMVIAMAGYLFDIFNRYIR